MIKKLFMYFLYLCLRFLLCLRYKVTVKGLRQLEREISSKESKGSLFLANHVALIDPCILLSVFWSRFRLHPVALDFLFQEPFVRYFLEKIGSLPLPNFSSSANSFKKKQIEKTYQRIFSLLQRGENLLIYPSGGLKRQAEEQIGGTSGIHLIPQWRRCSGSPIGSLPASTHRL